MRNVALGLYETLAGFGQQLWQSPLSPEALVQALKIHQAFAQHPQQLKWGIKTCLCQNVAQTAQFNDLFPLYFETPLRRLKFDPTPSLPQGAAKEQGSGNAQRGDVDLQ